MLGSKLSLFLYHFLTRLSVQTEICSSSTYQGFYSLSSSHDLWLPSFLSSLPFPSVHCRLMRSFLQNTLIASSHHSSDIRAAQHFQVPCITPPWAQEILQQPLARTRTQHYGSVTTHCSPVQGGLIEGLIPNKRRRKLLNILDNLSYLS